MRRVGWGVLDQALSSASNVLFVLALARLLEPAAFGYYILGYTALVALLAVSRGGLGTLITLAADRPAVARSEGGLALTTVGLVGLPVALVAALAVIALELPVHPVLALAAPVLLVQDISRITALAFGRPAVAVLGDGLWFAVSAGLLLATWAGLTYPAPLAVGLWVLGGTVSTLVLCALTGLRPSRSIRPLWSPGIRGDRSRFAAEASVGAVGSLALTTGVTGLIGPLANAALRGAGTVIGPINVLLTSLQVVVVPEMRRRRASGYWELSRLALPVVAVVGVCAAMVSVIGLLLPPEVGALLLGDSWVYVAPVLVVVGVEYVGQALLANGTTILRARADSRRLLRTRLTLTASQIVAGLAAAATLGSAIAVAACSAAVVWAVAAWLNTALALQQRRSRDGEPHPLAESTSSDT